MKTSSIKSQDTKKYEYIDILRAIAILGVLAVHSHQQIENLSTITSSVFNYGQLGVQLFFIASALTLCLSASERKENNPFNFYVRRFFRIAPLYYFGIILYFFWSCLLNAYKGNFGIPQGYTFLSVLENIFFVHGFDPSNFNFVVPGGWSIATEMFFYAIFPFLFALLSTLPFRTFVVVSFVIAIFSFFSQYIAIEILQPFLMEKGTIKTILKNDEFGYLYTLIINQINVFMIGMIAFKFLHKKIERKFLFLAAGLVIVSCFLQNNHTYDTGYDGFIYTILSSCAFAIFAIKLSGTSIPDNAFYRALINIGRNSFSMYIMHFIVIDVLRFVLGKSIYKVIGVSDLKIAVIFPLLVVITYYLAKKTNKYIENPGINFGKRFIKAAAGNSIENEKGVKIQQCDAQRFQSERGN